VGVAPAAARSRDRDRPRLGREFRVLSGLATTDVPVPRVFALCEDPAVNGAPFYVMERVDGRILRNPAMMAELSVDEARHCSFEIVDVLARLHSVDYEAVGLGDFGRPDGFLERNLRRWGKQWQSNKTPRAPGGRRARAPPGRGPPCAPGRGDRPRGRPHRQQRCSPQDDPGRIVAVLDWEMSTLGDPMTDLGLLAVYWSEKHGNAVLTAQGVSDVPGFLSRDEVMERYAKQSGRDLDALDFYVVFAGYKLAIIVEGIHARFLMGKTLCGRGSTTWRDRRRAPRRPRSTSPTAPRSGHCAPRKKTGGRSSVRRRRRAVRRGD